MGMVGRTYWERSRPVLVLARWATPPADAPAACTWHRPPRRTGPRTVLVQRADGSLVVRPFRGLRKSAP
jgi:hypothetical protein